MSRRRPRHKNDTFSGIILVMCLMMILGIIVVVFGMANAQFAG